jgi:hypothetical protein
VHVFQVCKFNALRIYYTRQGTGGEDLDYQELVSINNLLHGKPFALARRS